MEEVKRKSSIIRFFSNPLVGFIGSTASVVALIYVILSAIYGKEKKELTYYCNPIKTAIVKAGRSSALQVLCNSEKLESDITASQVALWNNGKKSIEKNDILEEIVIFTQPKTRIIESKILKTSRDVAGLVLNENNLKDGYLSVSWRILEHNDGGVLQLIYAGDEDVQILVRGIIKEQSKIKHIEYAGKIKSPLEQMNENARNNRLIAVALFVMGAIYTLMMMFVIRRVSKRKERIKRKLEALDPQKRQEVIESLEKEFGNLDEVLRSITIFRGVPIFPIISIATILLFAASIYLFFKSPFSGPPFGF